MKIIGKDNFDRESVADILVCENVANEYLGELMVDALNAASGEGGARFYSLRPDDYKLWRGMEEVV
ncbi:hypothetical protein [Aquamicrobium soli]|uniref:Uncharacterized protein n=1 Tax=Aquamicrobium soli TaxID=1811518 RepID=A0ABV7KBG8_9HYPH